MTYSTRKYLDRSCVAKTRFFTFGENLRRDTGGNFTRRVNPNMNIRKNPTVVVEQLFHAPREIKFRFNPSVAVNGIVWEERLAVDFG
jgi:hypothetical protein